MERERLKFSQAFCQRVIREHDKGRSINSIALDFGVSFGVVQKIVTGTYYSTLKLDSDKGRQLLAEWKEECKSL